MYICICHAVTDKDIRRAANRGVRTMRQLREETGCSGTCGQCAPLARSILEESQSATELPVPVMQNSPALA